jgi:hypothetical protein
LLLPHLSIYFGGYTHTIAQLPPLLICDGSEQNPPQNEVMGQGSDGPGTS